MEPIAVIFITLSAVVLFTAAVCVLSFVLSRRARKGSSRRAPVPRRSAGDIKGELGERQIGALLQRCLLRGDVLLNNVILSSQRTGSSTEIDHILLSTRGIFVIETKNRSGDIYGDDEAEEWVQVLGRGDVRHTFYSPVKQNEGHVSFVRAVTGARAVEGAVVFLSGNIRNVKSNFVYTPEQLRTYLSLCGNSLSEAERDEAISRLQARMRQNTVTAEEHEEYVRRRHGEK